MGGLFGSRFLANAVPVLLALFGVVLTNLPFSLFGGWIPSPMYALMPIYYWCLVRPDLMSPGWVLVIGVAHDVVSGEPSGPLGGVVRGDLCGDRQAARRLCRAVRLGRHPRLCHRRADRLRRPLHDLLALPLAAHAGTDSIKEFAVTSIMYAVVLPLLGWTHRRLVGPARSEF
jgi:hypothetical protein